MFDNGIDWLEQPQSLSGAWRDQWQESLELRVSESDMVAVVRLRAVRTDRNPEGQVTYRLIIDVDDVWMGKTPAPELTLTSAQQDSGYASVRSREQSVAGHPFLVYVKWYHDEWEALQARWQLSPASDAVRERTRELVDRRVGPRESKIK